MLCIPRKFSGFSLLETLIALLVLSIGLLGLAGLHIRALQYNNAAEFRSQATLLAMDIADRMRANRTAALSGAYVGQHGPVDCHPGFHAEVESVISQDLAEWSNSLACLLPGGHGAISLGSGLVTVRILWTETEGLGDGTAPEALRTFQLSTPL